MNAPSTARSVAQLVLRQRRALSGADREFLRLAGRRALPSPMSPFATNFAGCWSARRALLDQLRYDDWLAMYAPECIYWVPATPKAGDPRREIAIMFDDRRRLEDRIYRLRTGFAWSQAPASRTVRLITNVEVFATARDDARMLRSNFLISEFWGDETRLLSGWTGHRSCASGDGWKIRRQAGQPDRMRSVHSQSKHHPVVQWKNSNSHWPVAAMTAPNPSSRSISIILRPLVAKANLSPRIRA